VILPAQQRGLFRELIDVHAHAAVGRLPRVPGADHRLAGHRDLVAGQFAEDQLAVVDVCTAPEGVFSANLPTTASGVFPSATLLEVSERLDIEHGDDVREEERVEPDGFVQAERLERRFVEDRDWPHAVILPPDTERTGEAREPLRLSVHRGDATGLAAARPPPLRQELLRSPRNENAAVAGKTCKQALFLCLPRAARNLQW
jgi:hypothetical protein